MEDQMYRLFLDRPSMRIDVISLFPEMFVALEHGVVGRAIKNQKLFLKFLNPRDFTHDKYKTIDDRPYGGGPGMVMLPEPLCKAIRKARAETVENKVIYLSPKGQKLDQAAVQCLSQLPHLILIAGRYEGIDERVIMQEVDEEWSIGDYVLSGGELPAMVLIDAMARLMPGALGHEESAAQDSFSNGLLDCPHYTRPRVFESLSVPDVLLNGNHQAIEHWRLKQALGETFLKRPDLLAQRQLTELEQTLLNSFLKERMSNRAK